MSPSPLSGLRMMNAPNPLLVTPPDTAVHRSLTLASPERGWLGREDSNLRIRDPKSRALPLGHAPPLVPTTCASAACTATVTLTALVRAHRRAVNQTEV